MTIDSDAFDTLVVLAEGDPAKILSPAEHATYQVTVAQWENTNPRPTLKDMADDLGVVQLQYREWLEQFHEHKRLVVMRLLNQRVM